MINIKKSRNIIVSSWINIENLSLRWAETCNHESNYVADYITLAILWITGSFVAPSIRTWKRTSRWQYRRGKAGSDSECDGWRPPVDSFTNLLAKQTAWTHPVIIADGVSSARSRPYPIFIMPSPALSRLSLFLSFYLSLFLSSLPVRSPTTGRGSSPFSHHPFATLIFELYGCTLPRNYRWAPGVSVVACAIWIRVWNGISGLYVAQIATFDSACAWKRARLSIVSRYVHIHVLLLIICLKIVLRYPFTYLLEKNLYLLIYYRYL